MFKHIAVFRSKTGRLPFQIDSDCTTSGQKQDMFSVGVLEAWHLGLPPKPDLFDFLQCQAASAWHPKRFMSCRPIGKATIRRIGGDKTSCPKSQNVPTCPFEKAALGKNITFSMLLAVSMFQAFRYTYVHLPSMLSGENRPEARAEAAKAPRLPDRREAGNKRSGPCGLL